MSMISKIALGLSVLLLSLPSVTCAAESPIDFDLYGYIKLDVAYDTARTDVGNFHRWVSPHAINSDDAALNMTARESRLGFKIKGPKGEDYATSGQFEFDFYGGGPENKASPYMRHAFMKLEFPKSGWTLLGGQTWDVISPLNPSTVNYSVQWWEGNVAYRRPQLRLTKETKMGESTLTIAGAILRTIGREATDAAGTKTDPGEDAGIPTVQGRVGFSFPLGGHKSAIGFSGHWAREEFDEDAEDNNETVDSWSGHVDLSLKFGGGVHLEAEAWMGENMSAYLGGIAQGINGEGEAIRAKGGWTALEFGPYGKIKSNIGVSMDDPEDDDLADGGRALNLAAFVNTFIDILPGTTLGLEVARLQTDYKAGDETETADAFRVQSALIFKL